MMFASMDTSPSGLQDLIDATSRFCHQVGLCISAQKTFVIVFGEARPESFSWACDGQALSCVDFRQVFGCQAGFRQWYFLHMLTFAAEDVGRMGRVA